MLASRLSVEAPAPGASTPSRYCWSAAGCSDGGAEPDDLGALLDSGVRQDAAALTPDASALDDAAAPAPDEGVATDAGPGGDWCRSGDSEFARAAASLSAGEWVELDLGDRIERLGLHGHLLSWSDSGVYDPVARQVHWVGSPGTCCETPAIHRRLSFDLQTDEWSEAPGPWVDANGHAYDANALDPATGTHYFAVGADIRGTTGGEWLALPEPPDGGTVAVALTHFTGRNELLFVGNGIGGHAAVYDGAEWQAIDPGEHRWGTYHTFAEYDSAHDAVWMGSGERAVRTHYMLDAELRLHPRAEAPIDIRGSGASMKAFDAASGLFIVESGPEDRWFTYDLEADEWTEITDAIRAARPASWDPRAHNFVVSVRDCGVLLYVDQARGAGPYHAYLYRHAD